MTELFLMCRGANRLRIACQAETLTVRPTASHGVNVFKTACNRYGGDMIAHLVIRGHHRRRNVTSAEKLSRYWSRVHSWDMNVPYMN